MAIRFSITLLCALAVFAVGSGIGGVEAAEGRAARPVAEVYAGATGPAARATIPVLPTVYVTADSPAPAPVASGSSVMFDDAVGQAGAALAQGARRGVRRIGLAMPYYAFGSRGARTE
jgi:hypothetical protein